MGSNGPGKARPVGGGRLRTRDRGTEAPRSAPPSAPSAEILHDLLEPIAVDAMRGGLADRGTARRVQTALRAALLRMGLREADIQVELDGTALRVIIALPTASPRVDRIVLGVEAG